MRTRTLFNLLLAESLLCALEAVREHCTEVDTNLIGINSPTYHYHKCDKCGHVWSHDRSSEHFGDFDKEHTCPCGEYETRKYEPDKDEETMANAAYQSRITFFANQS